MNPSVKIGAPPVAPAVPELDPAEFDKLVNNILEDPDILLTADLTAEQILELQKRINPYSGIAGAPLDPERKRVIACSYTNLREDYLRRLTMTSLVGFLFQLEQEWEVPAEQRRWTPPAARGKTEPIKIADLSARLEATAAIAKEAEAAEAETAILRKALETATADLTVADIAEYSEEEIVVLAATEVATEAATEVATETTPVATETATEVAATEATPAVKKFKTKEEVKSAALEAARAVVIKSTAELQSAEARAAGLLYAATHATHSAGLEATAHLRATAEMARKHPEVREVLAKFPIPAPPGQLELPPALAKGIISAFLRNWFEFDPNVHVRAGHNADVVAAAVAAAAAASATTVEANAKATVDPADPSHLTLETMRAPATPPAAEHANAVALLREPRARAAITHLLRDDGLAEAAATALAAADAFKLYLMPIAAGSAARTAADTVPPQDTFHRWAYYAEVNYEELRTVTEALYPERADLDWAIGIWDEFEGTSEEVDAAFEKYCHRYQDEMPSAVRALSFGAWSLLADFKENRKKIEFFNKNTEVLKRILDRHAEDKRMGAELMRNRVRQTKARNIVEDGPDAPGLKEYKRSTAERGQDLRAKGTERVISAEEMLRLEKAGGSIKAAKELEHLEQLEKQISDLEGVAASRTLTLIEQQELDIAKRAIGLAREMVEVPVDAVQVDVFTTGGGNITKSHFYTKSDDADEASVGEQTKPFSGSESDHPAVRRMAK